MNRTKVRNALMMMYMDYDMYLNMRQEYGSSTGMVANYNATGGGGRTNRIARLTEQEALKAVSIDADLMKRLRWIDCVWSVFMKNVAHPQMRERNMGYVLFHKALLGWTFEKIASTTLPSGSKVTRQRIHQYYEMALGYVETEAEEMGLLR